MELNNCYLFNRLQEEDLYSLQKITQVKSYAKGSVLFYAGERPDKLRLIKSGVVQVSKHDASGNEIVLGDFHSNDLIAEMAHFEEIPYPATAYCKNDVVVYEIDFEAFKNDFLNRPDLAMGIILSLTRKVKQLEDVIRRALIDNAQVRLTRYLCEHADVLEHITQKQIASQIGLTPETVSRIIRQFKEKGWVEVRARKIVLIDLVSLKKSLEDND